jgi:hypothetical protein
MDTQPEPMPRLLEVTRRVGRSVESMAADTGEGWRRRSFAQHRLFDARRWRNGYGGPPFGVFRAARLRWWDELLAEVRDQEPAGVVITPRQLDDLIHLARKRADHPAD